MCVQLFRVLKSAVLDQWSKHYESENWFEGQAQAVKRAHGGNAPCECSPHIPLSKVGRVLRQTQANTTCRSVNANVEAAKQAAAGLDAFNAEATEAAPAAELVH